MKTASDLDLAVRARELALQITSTHVRMILAREISQSVAEIPPAGMSASFSCPENIKKALAAETKPLKGHNWKGTSGKVLTFIKKLDGEVNARQVAKGCGISEKDAKNALDYLRSKGKIQRTHAGKSRTNMSRYARL